MSTTEQPAEFATPSLDAITREIDDERQRQLTKWGDQHHPVHSGDATTRRRSRALFATYASNYREFNDGNFDPRDPDPRKDWAGIVLEEVYEALAEEDPAKVRAELVQAAAVICACVADLDSRTDGA
ncbi:hypothetical protein [Streptomonospora wellingtoniae]|uniref:Uncharacterized protein n=1 Tax=Streptomonospora wellingtoniae TaxID=3075544 RepID=A0ABU2L0K4_9ACTN|nr:hypothetical protein [Streptomonospora sp. DSM 45055]MDT0305084.1 hypothetical protein [Streptomonospora sp. DSM 45055]